MTSVDPSQYEAELLFDLTRMAVAEVEACGSALLALGDDAPHRQAVAQRLVGFLYETLRTPGLGEPGCVLVRCFQTCPYARLPLEYQHAAEELLEHTKSHPDLRCLTLLATRGDRLVWNDVATSINHQSIPLPSVEVVRRAPMIARLLEEMGVSLEEVVAVPEGAGFLVDESSDRARETFNVFCVERAEGSPYIPAQEEFVRRYGVRSVVGMGGLLPDGELFVVMLFTRVALSRAEAEAFRPLAESIRRVLVPFDASRTFEKLNA